MWMVIIMTENGGMTKLMDLDNFIIRTVLFMKENGKRIINMGSAMKDGQIMIVLEAITYKIKNMVKVIIHICLMGKNMKVNFFLSLKYII